MKKEECISENNIKVNQTEKINIAIEPGLKKSFKIKCIENNTEMSKVLKSFIYEYIKQLLKLMKEVIGMHIEEIIKRFPGAKLIGKDSYQCICPSHRR